MAKIKNSEIGALFNRAVLRKKQNGKAATEIISGRVQIPCKLRSIGYQNNSFKILKVKINAASSTPIPDCIPDEWLERNFVVAAKLDASVQFAQLCTYVFSGTIVSHEKYGLQFSADFAFEDEPSNNEMMSNYLSTLPNIGTERANLILEKHSSDELSEIFEKNPEELLEIPGITKKRLDAIVEKWNKDSNLRRIYYWLAENHVPVEYGTKILKEFGDRAITVLEKNPYRLIKIRGIKFPRADAIAHRILDEVPRPMRIKACGEYILKEVGFDGHLCLPYSEFKEKLCNKLREYKLDQADADAIPSVTRKHFVIIRHNDTGITLIYDPVTYGAERHTAFKLVQMSQFDSPYDCDDEDLQDAEKEYERNVGMKIKLDECQREAIKSAFKNKITIITGGGGTGKSTICRCIRSIAQKRGQSIKFMAPTGQAAKVLGMKTSHPAGTIHRTLGLTPDGVKELKYVDSDILVIDEFSMVGIDTFPYVMEAIKSCEFTNLVLVGDPQQLPSVASGNFLADIISSGIASVQKLKHLHRHSEKSYIARIANDISNGIVPDIPDDADDFMWINYSDLEDAAEKATMIVNKYINSDRIDEVQSLSPMYRSPAGVEAICSSIQQMMAGKEVFEYKGRIFYLGDRVMQLVNNYDKEIFNGTIGNIVNFGFDVVRPEIENVERYYIRVDFDGEIETYIADEIDELRVCWCSTVHKFQGSQMPIIVFTMTEANRRMMTRELVYTALTRASEKVYLIGSYNMLCLAARRSEIHKRYSSTADLIKWKIHGLPDDISVLNVDKVPEEF